MTSRKTAVLSGASGGLGPAIARRLADMNMDLVLLGQRPELDDVAADLRGGGVDVTVERLDLADGAEVIARARAILSRSSRIDVLVNNAGVGIRKGDAAARLDAIALGEWQHVLSVNLTAAFLLIQAFAPGMRDAGWGRIVNISSRAGRTGMEAGDAAYAATKAGLLGLTRKTAFELAPHGVTVNAIAAGRFDAGMARQTQASVAARALATIPVGRAGEAEELAATVGFLVSDEAAYMTGATLDLNGGAFMA